jgi:ABC-2 type transport system ATP-binding protein
LPGTRFPAGYSILKYGGMHVDKIIELNKVNKVYKNGRGIKDITFDIHKGDIFGFLGPNGAGKTTTMKIMTGLVRPDSGDAKLLGFSIIEQYEKAMEKVGCIIEAAEAYNYMTAFENLKQFSRYYEDVDNQRIEEVLELTGILKYKHENPGKFSLGMKQRLGIAAAILGRPEVLILDEPLNGLDVEGMIDLRNIIKKLAETKGTTFFISSHLIHDVELTCSRIGVIYDGRMLSVDTTKNILNNYASLENYFVSEVERNGRI